MENKYEYLENLSLEELINLKKGADSDIVPMIDTIIYSKTFTDTYIHKCERENKINNKIRIKQKMNNSYRRESRKNRR